MRCIQMLRKLRRISSQEFNSVSTACPALPVAVAVTVSQLQSPVPGERLPDLRITFQFMQRNPPPPSRPYPPLPGPHDFFAVLLSWPWRRTEASSRVVAVLRSAPRRAMRPPAPTAACPGPAQGTVCFWD